MHYPSWRYHPTLPARIVQTVEEDDALGGGWCHSPCVAPEAAPGPAEPVADRGIALPAEEQAAADETAATVQAVASARKARGIKPRAVDIQ